MSCFAGDDKSHKFKNRQFASPWQNDTIGEQQIKRENHRDDASLLLAINNYRWVNNGQLMNIYIFVQVQTFRTQMIVTVTIS